MQLPLFFKSRTIRQATALTRKNFITFYKSPISTIIRAVLFPVVVAVILCILKNILATTTISRDEQGIASSSNALKDVATALDTSPGLKLVFVRNGVDNIVIDPVIDGVIGNIGRRSHTVLDDPNDLFNECPQTLDGTSDCFAAVIFTNVNDTNVDYIIALDGDSDVEDSSISNYQDHTSITINRLMPLKWAIDSYIGNFSTIIRPQELPYSGCLYNNVEYPVDTNTSYGIWLNLITAFVSPLFMLVLMGVVYHLSLSVAGERQSGISELLDAQTCTTWPRILSNLVSFTLLYLPGWMISSILMTQILFTRTSDALLLFLTVLAGIALTCATHLAASFFRKGQMAALYTSTLMIGLAFVMIAFYLEAVPNFLAIQVLTFIFTPMTYSSLISDIARSELNFQGYSLAPNTTVLPPLQPFEDPPYPEFAGYRYVIIFFVQIVLFSLATFGVERWLWGVKRYFKPLDAGSDVTLRVTNLSKTFRGRRRWYWPFKVRSGSKVHAVDDFNIELQKGSVTFLLGPNGGGKTTTLKCIAGMHSMDSGSTLEISQDSLSFGVCPQLNVFWETLTVAENIKIWRDIKTAASSDIADDPEDVLVECDLLDKKNSAAKTLSGGQQRKLQLAIAFVGGSKMCCIDEASSGLDPLSRRNIWNIISRGHSKRTILMTTHFLDEADVLADYIAILYKGKMVCAGTSTDLKASHGDAYIIREIQEGGGTVWSSPSSADATKKILELEDISDASYSVQFPTLDQVFLKATDSTTHALHEGGDGIVDEIDAPKELEEVESIHEDDLNLDVGHAIGFFRQILVILTKRYILIRHTWISFAIALAVPIVIAAALAKFMHKFDPIVSCQENFENLHNLTSSDYSNSYAPDNSYVALAALNAGGYTGPGSYYSYGDNENLTIVGPQSQFEGDVQTQLWLESTHVLFAYDTEFGSDQPAWNFTNTSLSTRQIASSLKDIVNLMTTDRTCSSGSVFGIFAPEPESATLVHSIGHDTFDETLAGLSVITNRIANSTAANTKARVVQTTARKFRTVATHHDFRILPLVMLLIFGFVTSTSVAIIYPTDERLNNVRALQYSNSVSPAALWIAYLIYDMHVMVVTSVVTYACIFATAPKIWYDSGYVVGAMLLFGVATYLGLYLVSFFIKKAAFAIAAAIHIVLFLLYFAGYAITSTGSSLHKYTVYNQIQYGVALTSPAANLARAMFISANSFDVLCGLNGVVTPNPSSYNLYTGVYINLLVQIIFLAGVIALHEYGSTEWFYRIFWKKRIPTRLRYVIESGESLQPKPEFQEQERKIPSANDGFVDITRALSIPVLVVQRVSKYFGRLFATENVSFNIASNEVLALIGPNGAGKTSMINMIRGIMKPNYGEIHLDGINVLEEPQRAREIIGVCPQDDAIDELTTRETLNFYAAVKGLKDVKRNVDTVLAAFNITEFANVSVKKLSGGTRRKVLVSIAVLGNPRVLLLDEPSTGQDAGAKRVLWKVLQSMRRNRAILLTTHSMEEAEALATKVTILATRVLASGSLPGLKQEYGGNYHIRATYGYEQNLAAIRRVLQWKFGDVMSGLEIRYGEAEFELPHVTRNLGHILEAMESMIIGGTPNGAADGGEGRGGVEAAGGAGGRERVFKAYVVMEPTLEEVFLKVCKRDTSVNESGEA